MRAWQTVFPIEAALVQQLPPCRQKGPHILKLSYNVTGALSLEVADALDRRVEAGRTELAQKAIFVRRCARFLPFSITTSHMEVLMIHACLSCTAISIGLRSMLNSARRRDSFGNVFRPHDRTFFDLVLAEPGFVGFLKDFKAKYPDVYAVAHLFSQDSLENFFWPGERIGSQHTAPTYLEYGARVNQVLSASFSKPVAKGNTAR